MQKYRLLASLAIGPVSAQHGGGDFIVILNQRAADIQDDKLDAGYVGNWLLLLAAGESQNCDGTYDRMTQST